MIYSVILIILFVLTQQFLSSVFVSPFALLSSASFNLDTDIYFSEVTSWSFLMFAVFVNVILLFVFVVYLNFDSEQLEFVWKFSLFIFTVIFLFSLESHFPVILGWELIGVVSFRLISHWIQRSATHRAGNLAMTSNRIGDLLLLRCVIELIIILDYFSIWLSLALIVALSLKSTLAVSSLWLTEAMEGPTPVSSLLHSCTLVMAGIWVWLRITPCEILNNNFILPLCFLSWLVPLLTTSEIDCKRIIAVSTVAMVSFMWFILAFGLSDVPKVISLIHAGYKSALFIFIGRLLLLFSASDCRIFSANIILSVCGLIIFVAIAPVGSIYSNIKHAFIF